MKNPIFRLFMVIVVFLFFAMGAYCQGKWDAQWILGYDTTQNDIGGGTQFNFNENPLEISYIFKQADFELANASICDSTGNLLFYSNGCEVVNWMHKTMENGDTLSPGYILNSWCDDGYGSPIPQSVLALPSPIGGNKYYLLNYRSDPVIIEDSATVVPYALYLNKIDMDANGGLGIVTEKQIPVIEDTLSAGYLQAVRHGNGKDWWVVAPEFFSNCYYIFRLTSDGAVGLKKQCIGNQWFFYTLTGQAAFSPNGVRYAKFHSIYGLQILDFDRCEGVFSNPIAIDFPQDTFSRSGIAFSPNSRFLYASAHTKLYQFDMESQDALGSKFLIDEYDGFAEPYPTRFYMATLAMDGKIYISCPGTHNYIHVIHQPDSLGVNCNFEQHSIQLASLNYSSMPNLAHYRLGAEQPECDTILNNASTIIDRQIPLLYPNPSSSLFTVEFTDDFDIQVFNAFGDLVVQKKHIYDKIEIDCNSLSSGIYFVELKSGNFRVMKKVFIMK